MADPATKYEKLEERLRAVESIVSTYAGSNGTPGVFAALQDAVMMQGEALKAHAVEDRESHLRTDERIDALSARVEDLAHRMELGFSELKAQTWKRTSKLLVGLGLLLAGGAGSEIVPRLLELFG